MPIEFDPYLEWLGIQITERPLDHYALLGLPRFESSEKLIDQHSVKRIELLQDIATGSEQVELSQRILNEISTARICLLDPRKRAKYDLQLKKRIAGFDSAISRIERLSASEDPAQKKELPAASATPISVAISTAAESKKRKSGENPIPQISKRKKPWVFPLVAMIIPLLMGIGVLIGVYIFVTPQLREDFDKLNYGRTNVIETIHEEESLGDPLNLNQTQPKKSTTKEKSTKNPKQKKSSPKKVASPTDNRGHIIASYNADKLTASNPKEQGWRIPSQTSDFKFEHAKDSKSAAWKIQNHNKNFVIYRKPISENDFALLSKGRWQLTVIARLIEGEFYFHLQPSKTSNYWKSNDPEKPNLRYSIHLKKLNNGIRISPQRNGDKSAITADKKGFVKIIIEGYSSKNKFQLSAYSLSEDQKSELLIDEKKEIDPSKIKSNLNSSFVSIGSGSPKSDANQPCEIWIHKIELKALD